MKYELHLHRVAVGLLTLLLGGFIAYSLHLRPVLAHARFDAIGALFVVTVAAGVFVTIGIIEGTIAFQFGGGHRRELITYLLLGFISLASGLYLAISDTSTLQTVALVASPHALLFGFAELRIARHFQRHPNYSRGLKMGGVVEICLGLALIFGSSLPTQHVASLLIYVSLFTMLQLVPIVFFQFPRAPDPL